MTAPVLTSGHETAVPGDTDGDLRWALRIAKRVRDSWCRGSSPDMVRVLSEYPRLKNHRTLVFELAFDEYRLRQKAGERLDADEFSQRFHSMWPSMYWFITIRSGLENDPAYAEFLKGVPWPEPGSHFLGFDLIGEIGRGAKGRVFLASERALGERQVVVKVAPQNGREAAILGPLRHANIVRVYSIQEDEASGLTAFCMPFLGQATLAAVIDRVYAGHGPPTRARTILDAVQASNQGVTVPDSPPPHRVFRGSYVDGAIHLGLQLAEALAYANGKGVLHRDLKPSNVLMSSDGQPLLLDFNLSLDERNPVWKAGGTLPYMAPEELAYLDNPSARSSGYDVRSDLFSLGVVLYEVLTGHLPFGMIPCTLPLKEIPAWLRQQQARGPRPIQQYNRQVDGRLARLIDRCLAFDPALRPADAGALAVALRNELSPPRRTRRWAAAHPRLAFAGFSTVLAPLLGMATFLALRPPYAVREFQRGLVYGKAGEDASALDCLNAVLQADPRNIEALTARARVHQHQGVFQLAFADYEAASRLAPLPNIDACKGYCLSRLVQHVQAAALYRQALEHGYDSPAVLNNLGYSCFHLGRIADAEAYLRKAVAADDSLQAPHHNLVLVFVQQAYAGKPIPAEAFHHALRAEEIGPPSGELFRDLATLYALAAQHDKALGPKAIGYIARAVDFGIHAESLQSDAVFSGLKQNPAFGEAIALHRVLRKPVEAVLLIDLSGELPSP